VEFRILGPLEINVGGQLLDPGSPRQQLVLGALLVNANRVVSVARLVDVIYGSDPPTTARSQVQICVSGLRRLFAAHGHSHIILTQSQGYTIRTPDERLDARRFENLLVQARRLRESGQLDEAVDRFRAGLSLWRGEALAGLEAHGLRAAVNRLTEYRITGHEDCLQLELELGRHSEIVGELRELVERYPLRQRLRGQLMLALYRSGRQAESLEVYRNGREIMVEELGIEPDESLQRLHHAVLTSDDSLGPPPLPQEPLAAVSQPPSLSVPRLLPTDIADFTGRTKQVDTVLRQLADATDAQSVRAVPVIVITGRPGIGKSTIAVHLAHQLTDRFPDGQLFADLHGGGPQLVSPTQVLERFLRALGVPGAAVPDDLEARAETYRALLADRRALIVLDDAGTESQVLPLLPGTPGCAVLITSRSRLAGLPGAVHIGMGVFEPQQSTELLARIVGQARMQAESRAVATLAELCDHLPLALRIAGARLAARPSRTVEQMVSRLKDETRRLDELRHGDLAIRASISLTYEGVTDAARRLFRRLAILEVRQVSVWIAAALLDVSPDDAQDLLDDLADAHLIETTNAGAGVHSRYRLHDLIRVFARERLAAEEPPAERTAALGRVLGALLFLTGEAHRREYGGDSSQVHSDAHRWPLPGRFVDQVMDEPLAWYERERLTLIAGIRQAARAGFIQHCWDLAVSAVTLFESRIYFDDWRETHEIALTAARQAGDLRGEATMLYSIGSLNIAEQRFGDARRNLDAALRLFSQAHDELGKALAVCNIAFLDRVNGRHETATGRYEEALASFTRIGDDVAAAYVLHSLARIKLECAEPVEAERLLQRALQRSRAGGSRRVEAQVLYRLGESYLASDSPDQASETLEQALTRVRDIGDPRGEAHVLHALGMARLRRGEHSKAGAALQRALDLAVSAGARLLEGRVLFALGELAMTSGEVEESVGYLHRALDLFRKIDVPLYEANVLVTLSEACAALGDEKTSREAAAHALGFADRMSPLVGDQIRKRLVQGPR